VACDMGLPSESRPHRGRHPGGGEGVVGPLGAALTMTDDQHRHLVIWEARHDNGRTMLVAEARADRARGDARVGYCAEEPTTCPR